MGVFTVGIKHPLDMTVQRLHDGDTGEHGWSTLFDYQHQGLDRGLPFRQSGFLLWEAGYVIGCLPQGDQLAISNTIGSSNSRDQDN